MSKSSDSALTAAIETQRHAAADGFDWPDAEGPRAKIVEELAELEHATVSLSRHSRESGNPVERCKIRAEVSEELGDLLFAVVNLARHLDVEPEAALAASTEKFKRRFRYIEERLAAQGLLPSDVGLDRLDALWDEAKRQEGDRLGP